MRRFIRALPVLLAGLVLLLAGCKPTSSGSSSSSYTGWNPVPVADGGGVAVRTGTAAGTHLPEWALAVAAGGAAAGAGATAGTLLKSIESDMTGDPCNGQSPHHRIAMWSVSRLRHGRQGRPRLDCKTLGNIQGREIPSRRPSAQQVIACLSAIFRHGDAVERFGEVLWRKENAWVIVESDGRIVHAVPGSQGWAKCAGD